MLKIVMFYNQFAAGWSETWYSNSNDPRAFLQDVFTDLFLNAAIQFRHQATILVAARATVVGAPGKLHFSTSYGTKYRGQRNTRAGKSPDVVSTDAVVRVNGTLSNSKRMFIRGLIDDDVVRNSDGTDEPSAALAAGIDGYIKGARTISLGLKVLLKPGDLGTVAYNVLKVAPVAGDIPHSDVITTVALGGEIAVGDYVRFLRVPFDSLPGFPAQAQVVALNPGGQPGVRINYYLREQADYHPISMKMMKYGFIVDPVGGNTGQQSVIERFSEHKTGRPFGQPRGRARAKVRAL